MPRLSANCRLRQNTARIPVMAFLFFQWETKIQVYPEGTGSNDINQTTKKKNQLFFLVPMNCGPHCNPRLLGVLSKKY